MINDIRPHLKFLGVFLLTLIIYLPFTRLGVDSHHDGIMLTPALVVARGGVIHRDIFSQYGPITAYLQAVFVWIFGPHLLSIRIASATYLSLAIALLYSCWRRVLGEGIALFGYLLLISSSYFFVSSSPMHPWSSDVMLFLQALTLYLLVVGHSVQGRKASVLIYMGGFVLGLQFTNRYVSALLMLIGLTIYYLFQKKMGLRPLWLGVMSSTGVALFLLLLSRSFDEWYFQAIQFPRNWVSDVSGSGGWLAIRVAIVTRALPGGALLLMVVFGFNSAALRKKSFTSLQRVSMVLFGSSILIVTSSNLRIPYWNTSDVLWTFAGVFLIATPWYFLRFQNRVTDDRTGEAILFIAAASASTAIFPISDIRHLFWGLIPSIGPCLMFLKSHINLKRNQVVLASLSLVLLVPSTLQSVEETVDMDRVSVANTPILKGMLMDRKYSQFFNGRFQMIDEFLAVHPEAPILNICSDGLFAALATKLKFPDPYFVSWQFGFDFFSTSTPEGRHRLSFVQNARPIVWMCPLTEDPQLIAEKYHLRLIPIDPNVDIREPYNWWPYVSYLGVPKEWPLIDLELSYPSA
jgi:hypothetical protein